MKTLDKYFKKAKLLQQLKPFISKEEILEKLATGTIEQSNFDLIAQINLNKRKNRRYKMGAIISSLVIIGSMLVLQMQTDWLGIGEKVYTPPASSQEEVIKSIPNQELGNKMESTMPKSQEGNTNTPPAPSQEGNTNTPPVPSQEGNIVNVPIMRLSDVELEKIGIKRTPTGYEFTTESMYMIDSRRRAKEIASFGYDTTIKDGIYREHIKINVDKLEKEKIIYGNWDIKNPLGTCPAAMNIWANWKEGGTTTLSSSFGFSPLINVKTSLFSEKDNYFRNLIEDKKVNLSQENFLTIESEKYPYLKQLIPLHLKITGSDNVSGDILLFYVPTSKFVKLLPERYKSYFDSGKLATIERINLKDIDRVENKEIKEPEIVISKVPGLNTIDLNKNQLELLGITNKNDSFNFQIEAKFDISIIKDKTPLVMIGVDTNLTTILLRNMCMVSKEQIGSDVKDLSKITWDRDTTNINFLLPIVVTATTHIYEEGKWKNHALLSFLNEGSPVFKINREIFNKIMRSQDQMLTTDNYRYSKDWYDVTKYLIPIHTIIGNKDAKEDNEYTDIIFWFPLSDELLQRLPAEESNKLKKELELLSKIESGKITSEEACEALKGKLSYLNLCGISSGAIKSVIVFPNPTMKGSLNCKIILTEERTLKISLHDLDGELISNLKEETFNSGENQIQIQNKALKRGIYLLSVASDKGERVIEKVIVQ